MRSIIYKIALRCIAVLSIIIFSNSPLRAQMISEQEQGSSLQQSSKRIYLEDISFNLGYTLGELDQNRNADDLQMYSLTLRLGFNINNYLGLENHKGTFQVGLEPHISPIADPIKSIAIGAGIMLRYSYPLMEKLRIYGEFGAGPMYFGIDTWEQGNRGFEFLDQGGGGIMLRINDNKAINFGYRVTHISNAGISSRNNGINGETYYFGITSFF